MDALRLAMRQICTSGWQDARGTTAVEFAMVGPIFIALVIGTFYLCLCLFAIGSVHYAVEAGARCASVRTTQCTDATSTLAYTKSQYFGPSSTPTFTYNATATCGHAVSGSLNYVVELGLETFTVPITATACYP